MIINDWFNGDVISVNLNGGTFEAWRYNRDYSKIYVDTLEGETIELECDNTSVNCDYDYQD